MKLLRFIFFFFILTLLLACGSENDENQGNCDASIKSSGYLLSNDCRALSWGMSIPIKIYYGSSLSEEAISAFEEAIRIWENAVGKNLFDVLGNFSDFGAENDTLINTIGMRSGSQWTASPIEGKADEPAKTIYYYKNFIYNADIFLNSDFPFSVNGTPNTYDLVSIALHELGHVLGLDHDDSSPLIVMNSKIYKGMMRRTLTKTDIQRVRSLYPF